MVAEFLIFRLFLLLLATNHGAVLTQWVINTAFRVKMLMTLTCRLRCKSEYQLWAIMVH